MRGVSAEHPGLDIDIVRTGEGTQPKCLSKEAREGGDSDGRRGGTCGEERSQDMVSAQYRLVLIMKRPGTSVFHMCIMEITFAG